MEINRIRIVRFLDKDIKQVLNDDLRILEKCVEGRSFKKEKTPPCPPQGGNFPRKVLNVDGNKLKFTRMPSRGEFPTRDSSEMAIAYVQGIYKRAVAPFVKNAGHADIYL